jgi:hypothetical protein
MQDEAADDVGDVVQASESESLPAHREGPVRSSTEQARFVAGYFGWSITGDQIRDVDNAVALYIEDLAVALGELGWISPVGIHWNRLPFREDDAAEALHDAQRTHGWDV